MTTAEAKKTIFETRIDDQIDIAYYRDGKVVSKTSYGSEPGKETTEFSLWNVERICFANGYEKAVISHVIIAHILGSKELVETIEVYPPIRQAAKRTPSRFGVPHSLTREDFKRTRHPIVIVE